MRQIIRRLNPPQDEFEELMLSQYSRRAEVVEPMASYYEKYPKSPLDRAFEEHYTAYSDRGVMDYVHDLLAVLIEQKKLGAEAEAFLKMISRTS